MLVFLLGLLSICLYFILKYKHTYWSRRGITQDNPRFLFGSVDKKILTSGNPTKCIKQAYFDFKKKGVKHGGIYLFYTPIWIPIDLDLIKRVLLTDFDYFTSHGFFHHKKDTISEHIFNKDGEEWKKLRSNLSPTFTPAKLKVMYDTLYMLANRMEERIVDTCNKRQPINIKEITANYLTEVSTTCFFGIELNSSTNEFQYYGHLITQARPFRQLLEFLLKWELLAHLGYSCFQFKVKHFFSRIIKEAIDAREKNRFARKDYLDTLIELHKDGGPLNFDDVVANSLFMYIAGYETSTSTLTYLMYELAKNQKVQDELRSEILGLSNNNANYQITYEDLTKMKYADICINETLRCYPALAQLPRLCTKQYQIPGTDQIIEKGTITLIPVWAIQNDPDYFSNAAKFDPENMSNSNGDDAWFGFGYGPRLCLGYKFAAMQIKIALVKYLTNYRYRLNISTPENLTFNYNTFLLYPVEEIILDMEALN